MCVGQRPEPLHMKAVRIDARKTAGTGKRPDGAVTAHGEHLHFGSSQTVFLGKHAPLIRGRIPQRETAAGPDP